MLCAAPSRLVASSFLALTNRLCLGAQTNNSAMFAEVLPSLCLGYIQANIHAALTEATLTAATVGLH